jgi:hypothetical protein
MKKKSNKQIINQDYCLSSRRVRKTTTMIKKQPQNSYQFVWIILLIAAVMYFNGIMSLNVHEEIHKQIFRNYDVSSTIQLNYLTLTGVTTPNMTQYNKYCNESCNNLNVENEIIGYNTILLIISLWLMVIVVTMIIWRNK